MTNNRLNATSGQDQQYCLRWNNHQTNLTNVFVQLFRSEEFTDTTLFCEGGPPVKCHKMVLAACSSYFQSVFAEVPGKHSAVVLKDVGHAEMKAILDYMYKGEVNIAHDQLAALLKVAEMLKVKGLVQDTAAAGAYQPHRGAAEHAADEDTSNIISTSSPNHVSPDGGNTSGAASKEHQQQQQQQAISVNNNNNNEHSGGGSPPHSTGISGGGGGGGGHHHHHMQSFYGKHGGYNYGKSPSSPPPPSAADNRQARGNVPVWPLPALHMSASTPVTNHVASMFGGSYDAGYSGVSPLRRKKMMQSSPVQSMVRDSLMARDTPILRTVLGQGQADSSQQQLAPAMMMYGSEAMEHHRPQSNGSEHSGGQFSKVGVKLLHMVVRVAQKSVR